MKKKKDLSILSSSKENLWYWGLLFAKGLTNLFSVLIDGQRAGVLPPHSVCQPEEKEEEEWRKKKSLEVAPHHLAIRSRRDNSVSRPVAEAKKVRNLQEEVKVDAQPHIAKSLFIKQMVYLSHTSATRN